MRCQQISLKEGIIIQPLTLLICPVDPCAGLFFSCVSLTNMYLKFG